MNSHSHTTEPMGAEQARQIGRHVKAALLHLVMASRSATATGINLVAGDDAEWTGHVTGDGLDPARAFNAALDGVGDLDEWAIGNVRATRAGDEVYAGTERWCHTAGGVLPTAAEAGPVSAERIRGIAALADQLAKVIDTAYSAFRTRPGEHVPMTVEEMTNADLIRRAGFRLPDAAGQARYAARQLRETAMQLERIAAVPADACRISWPVCPDHGNTISASGGSSWCRVRDCGRQWDYDRGDIPCPEPVRWRVTDQYGNAALMCDGHARDARTVRVGTITRLEGEVPQ
jgi:hypothetical protein